MPDSLEFEWAPGGVGGGSSPEFGGGVPSPGDDSITQGSAAAAAPTLKDKPIDKSITQFDPQLQKILDQILGLSGTASGRASNLFDIATPALKSATDFFGGILQGKPTDIARLIGPEIDAISKQYDVARKQMAGEHRGGGKDLALASSRFSQAGDISRSISTARGTASQKLAEIAGIAGQLGQGQSTVDATTLQSLGSLLGNLRGQEIGVRGQDINQDAANAQLLTQLGVGIGGIIADLIGKLGNKSNSGSAPTINIGTGSGGSSSGGTPPFGGDIDWGGFFGGG